MVDEMGRAAFARQSTAKRRKAMNGVDVMLRDLKEFVETKKRTDVRGARSASSGVRVIEDERGVRSRDNSTSDFVLAYRSGVNH